MVAPDSVDISRTRMFYKQIGHNVNTAAFICKYDLAHGDGLLG
jgi:hypothetical protein